MPEELVSREKQQTIRIRQARPEDAPACGEICFEAFREISQAHSFAPDIPELNIARGILSSMFSHSGFYCVVAERGGVIVGSNCIDFRSSIAGIGPITVDARAQNAGAGRLLMIAVMERAKEHRAPGVRLVQAAFHNRSLSLYAKLGFDAREPLSVMQGRISVDMGGCRVRRAGESDMRPCDLLCARVHGHDRHGELADAVAAGTALVVERSGRITAYATNLAFFGHAVGESNLDLEALIGSDRPFGGPGILVPTRNAALFRWCLEHGLRVVEPMTLMSTGLYSEPAGAWLPSVSF